jgi:hypothetical protein
MPRAWKHLRLVAVEVDAFICRNLCDFCNALGFFFCGHSGARIL